MARQRVKPIIRRCPICSSTFEVGGRGRRPLKSRYCSKHCASVGRVVNPTVAHLSETQAAYIAGLLDGEGSILMLKRPGGVRLGLRVVIVNTHRPVLDWLAETVGGNITTHPVTHTNYSRQPKPCWTWVVNGQNAVFVLTQLLPYLIIKREKAIAGIASQPIRIA